MRRLLTALRRLNRRQRLIIAFLLVLVAITWTAACVVITVLL